MRLLDKHVGVTGHREPGTGLLEEGAACTVGHSSIGAVFLSGTLLSLGSDCCRHNRTLSMSYLHPLNSIHSLQSL